MRLLLAAGLAALLLVGCTGQPVEENAEDFQGEQRAVAEVIDELSELGRDQDGAGICASVLAQDVVAELEQSGEDCGDVLADQLSDASDFTLDVRSIEVQGDTATAQVESPVDGEEVVQTLTFVRQGGDWRLSGLELPQG